MRKWYNAVVILMFVVGVALIAGSVIYYLWAVERLGDNVDSEDEFLPELPTQSRDDFRQPPRQFSVKAQQQQPEKDEGVNEDAFAGDSDESVTYVGTETEAATTQENDAHKQPTNEETPDAETSNAREQYIQERGRKAIAELPQMISEWKQMTEEWSSVSRTLPAEERDRIHENLKELEDKILLSAFDYIAATDDVDTLNAMFEGTIWSFD